MVKKNQTYQICYDLNDVNCGKRQHAMAKTNQSVQLSSASATGHLAQNQPNVSLHIHLHFHKYSKRMSF